MKKVLLFLYLLSSISCPLFAQWSHQISGTSNNLNTVHFTDNSNGWSAGNLGTLLYTTNSGTSWTTQSINTTENINCIRFVNSVTGWVVGNNGTVFKTTNRGINWNQLNISSQNLRSVFFIDEVTGWIVGDSTTILKTTDGGASWVSQSDLTSFTIFSVFFINSNTGWIAYKGGVLKTTNGGTTWKVVNITAREFHSVYFLDEMTGWVVGSVYSIYKSTDGGESWGQEALAKRPDNGDSPPAIYTSVYFQNADTGWYTVSHSLGGRISKTLNGGSNWGTDFPSTMNESLYSMFFVNSGDGWAVGENGTILHTSRGIFTGISGNISTPKTISLSQNYPNPFNPSTSIKYSVSSMTQGVPQNVKLIVYDITGRDIETLVNEKQSPGNYEIKFDATKLPSGSYFYQLRTDNFIQTKKMLLIK